MDLLRTCILRNHSTRRRLKFMRTIDVLFEETGLAIDEVAQRAKLSPERVEAIAVGRWTPSPDERRRIAEVFGTTANEIAWGHTMDPRNVRYRRYGIKEEF